MQQVEKGKAILELSGGQLIKIAKEELEPIPALGTAYVLQIMPAAEAELGQSELAERLLDQLLNHP
ncbi:MAG: hypothetical protein WCG94_08920 [Methanothrix sp.]